MRKLSGLFSKRNSNQNDKKSKGKPFYSKFRGSRNQSGGLFCF
jgi:hypothetical protein